MQNDYGPENAREATERFSQGPIATAENGGLECWIHDIRNAAEQARVVGDNLRAYRTALAGPDDRLEKNPNIQAVEEPPHPSKMIQMQDAIKELFSMLNRAQCEYQELESKGLVSIQRDHSNDRF